MDLIYDLNKYIQYKHVGRLLEEGCLYQEYLIIIYRLNRNENFLETFANSTNKGAFYGPELNL